jgi:hypothetical protein
MVAARKPTPPDRRLIKHSQRAEFPLTGERRTDDHPSAAAAPGTPDDNEGASAGVTARAHPSTQRPAPLLATCRRSA